MGLMFWRKKKPEPVKEYQEPEFVSPEATPEPERPKPVVRVHDIEADAKDYRIVWDKL